MKQIIPYSKRLDFKNKIFEVSTISLEHELNVRENEICGDFIVSGEYKTSEISVNKEKFLHRLPFSIDYSNRIDRDSVDFNITDFEYDIDGSELVINIEASIDVEEELVEFSSAEEIPVPEEENIEAKAIRPEVPTPDNQDLTRANDVVKDALAGNTDAEDVFVKYHVHIVREDDNFEKIALLYNTTVAEIQELNKVDTITLGSKLIITEHNE